MVYKSRTTRKCQNNYMTFINKTIVDEMMQTRLNGRDVLKYKLKVENM